MPTKRVPFLQPGVYRLPNGRTVEHTRDSIRKLVDRGNRLLAAGLRVPLCWMHDPDAAPQYLSHGTPAPHADAWKARHWFGEATRFQFDPATGTGVAVADIPDPKDADRFQKVGQVSPGIYTDWIDEKNVLWPGQSLLHIASTPQPVARHLPRVTDAHPQLFSHPVRAKDAYWLSLPADIRSANMADEYDDDKETGEGEGVDLSEVIDLLKKLDIHGMDGVSDMPTLVAALKAAVHTKLGEAEGDDDTGEEPDGDEGGPAGTEAVGAPVLMSQSLANALLKRVGELEYEKKVAAVNALLAAGQITKAIHADEMKELTAQKMSHPAAADFDADGQPKKTAQDIRLDAYAKLPKSKFADRQFMSQPAGTQVVQSPALADGQPADKFEQWKKEELDKALERTGLAR